MTMMTTLCAQHLHDRALRRDLFESVGLGCRCPNCQHPLVVSLKVAAVKDPHVLVMDAQVWVMRQQFTCSKLSKVL